MVLHIYVAKLQNIASGPVSKAQTGDREYPLCVGAGILGTGYFHNSFAILLAAASQQVP